MSTSSATAAVEDNAGRDALTPNERLCVDVRNFFVDEATQDDAPLLAYKSRLAAAAAGDELMTGVFGYAVLAVRCKK